MVWSIKTQEVRAGGFNLKFTEDANTVSLTVSTGTYGKRLTFQRDGDIISIIPAGVLAGEPVQHNPLLPGEINAKAQADAAARAARNNPIDARNSTIDKENPLDQG